MVATPECLVSIGKSIETRPPVALPSIFTGPASLPSIRNVPDSTGVFGVPFNRIWVPTMAWIPLGLSSRLARAQPV